MAKTSVHMGDYKVRCDISGLTFLRSECQFTWDNKLAAKEYWDPKQPQLIIKPRQDNIAIKDARPTSENDADLPFGEGDPSKL